MSYQPYVVPVRSQMYDGAGRLTLQWQTHFSQVAMKAGRSLTWRGAYDGKAGVYSVNDVVGTGDDDTLPALWVAQQANPVNGTAVEPGSEEAKKPGDRVWALLFQQKAIEVHGIPAGGTTGQVLTKASDTDYDADWEDGAGGGGGGVTLPIAESDVTGLVADLAAKAPLASPALAGTPTAPTAAPGTNTTQIATTAFVEQELGVSGSGAYFAWGGDGSDGAVTFDGAATILGMAPSGGVYTLTRDICCTDITVNSGVTIKTANYAIFATGTVTVNGTVQNDGTNGLNGSTPVSSTGGNGGTQGSRAGGAVDGHYPRLITPVAGAAGGNGGTTTGAQAGAANAGNSVSSTPVDATGVAGATGASGGKGGTGTSGAGGAARTGGAAGGAFSSANLQTGRHASVAVSGVSWNNSTSTGTAHPVWASNAANGGAAGGSGGGGDGTNSGGGGGGGGGEGGSGGVVAIFAHTIAVGATGIIRSNGGAGGNGGNGRTPTTGNCGGGGGGAGGSGGVGGIVWLIYHRYTNAGTVQANGGAGGTGGTKGSPSGSGTDDAANGSNGSTGPAGNVVTIPC